MTAPTIKIGTSNEGVYIGFPEWEKSLETTCWIVSKILNIIRTCFPCLTDGVAEIQLSQKIYYVYRSDLARTLECNAQASCSNREELKALALNYFNKNKARSEPLALLPTEHPLSSLEHLVLESHQAMDKSIAAKEKSDAEAREKLESFKKEQAVKEEAQIAQIRATVAHLPDDDPRRLNSERFIKDLKDTRKSMLADLDEIAISCGIAPASS